MKLPAYEWFGGPAFGAESVLQRFGASRPLLVAILKPSLDPEATLEKLEERIAGPLAGGFHAAKDDEMQGGLPETAAEDSDRAGAEKSQLHSVRQSG